MTGPKTVECPVCSGNGCNACDGSGEVEEGSLIDEVYSDKDDDEEDDDEEDDDEEDDDKKD